MLPPEEMVAHNMGDALWVLEHWVDQTIDGRAKWWCRCGARANVPFAARYETLNAHLAECASRK